MGLGVAAGLIQRTTPQVADFPKTVFKCVDHRNRNCILRLENSASRAIYVRYLLVDELRRRSVPFMAIEEVLSHSKLQGTSQYPEEDVSPI